MFEEHAEVLTLLFGPRDEEDLRLSQRRSAVIPSDDSNGGQCIVLSEYAQCSAQSISREKRELKKLFTIATS